MTPQEKARELKQKFIDAGFMPFVAEIGVEIVVDEILQADMFIMTEEQEKFWEEVKIKIQKQ